MRFMFLLVPAVSMECEGIKHQPPKESVFVDPMTGVRVTEVLLEIRRDDLEPEAKEVRCRCLAWNPMGETTSKYANILKACKFQSKCCFISKYAIQL